MVTPGSSASVEHGYGAAKGWSGRLGSHSGQTRPLASAGGGAATATLERPAVIPVALKAHEDPLAGLIDKMCRVKDEALLGQVFLDHLAPTLKRTILFRVKGGAARVWDSRGVSDGPADESASLQITSEPVFKLLAGQKQYAGPVPPGPSHTGFFEKLGFRPPQDMLLAPAYLNDRLVALLYGDNGAACGLPTEQATYARLTDKLALGIGLVDLKRQLREI